MTPSKRVARRDTATGMATSKEIPRRMLGNTGVTVSAIGLGGYHLGLVSTQEEATRIVRSAIEAGVTFMDNAWEYHEGKSEKRLGKALAGGWRDRAFLMTKVCTHGRDRKTAMRQLEESLRRLGTDYLDLWQVHEVAYHNDPERHFAAGGVIEALAEAKASGKVRFVGFTGHKDPALHLRMLSHGFPFDTCQLPLNPFDATHHASFEQQVLPELVRRGIAPIGMKSMGGEGDAVKKKAVSAKDALRYAMSLPVATTVSGVDSMTVLRQNIGVARGFTPMRPDEMEALRSRLASVAADGRFELYKSTAKHEGAEGRKQHGFPSEEDVAA
ncbi:MAG: aldo/keto reductase [Gemmatimonadaceae bacterium]